VTTNVTAKSATFLHETNHGCTVVSYFLTAYHTGENVGQKQLNIFHGL